MRGPLRDAFLCAAAALLCVPERYMQVLAQLGQGVAQGRRALYYVEGRLGTAANFGVNEVAQFLASVGVTSDEAEQWRPWAAAFIEMELEGRPNGRHAQMLRQARDSARACIDSDPKWVFKNIHADAPGNYNPALEQSRAMRSMARQAEAGSSSNAEAGPSSAAGDGEVHIRPAHSDAADDCDVHLDHEGEQNDELRMAPA